MVLPSSSGVPPRTSMPCFDSVSTTSGDFKRLWYALDSLSTMSRRCAGGAPAGRNHRLVSKPGKAGFAHGRQLRRDAGALQLRRGESHERLSRHAEARSAPARTSPAHDWREDRSPPVRCRDKDVHELHARHLVEQFAGEMRRGADAGRGEGQDASGFDFASAIRSPRRFSRRCRDAPHSNVRQYD